MAPLRRLLRWWRGPLWLAALGTGSKSFVDNPILGSARLNRAGLHVNRLKLAHSLAWRRRRKLATDVPAAWREQFDRNGFVVVPDFLSRETFERLRSALLDHEWDCRAHQQGSTVTRRVPIGPDILGRIPELRTLLASSRWRGLLAYVASTRSQPLYYIQTIVSGIPGEAPDPQLQIHSDTFHPSLKAWLFLTDVADDGGPLTYVAGSHILTPERLAWEQAKSSTVVATGDRLSQRGSFRVSAEELPLLGLPAPIRFAVPANTVVAIDTFGFHARAESDRPTVRVEIWAYGRRTPFLPSVGFDPLSWRPIADRRAQWLAAIMDWLDRLSLATQHWRPAGRRRPVDP
ncbi:MAG: phytanoyl-CoA dioxygenase family protein [Sphingomonas sp.]|nr:phytanoyl-CoA dioxygenase family protein [Sphingomonas sp.]